MRRLGGRPRTGACQAGRSASSLYSSTSTRASEAASSVRATATARPASEARRSGRAELGLLAPRRGQASRLRAPPADRRAPRRQPSRPGRGEPPAKVLELRAHLPRGTSRPSAPRSGLPGRSARTARSDPRRPSMWRVEARLRLAALVVPGAAAPRSGRPASPAGRPGADRGLALAVDDRDERASPLTDEGRQRLEVEVALRP